MERKSATTTRKMYYSISEVCTQTGLEPHVLRYWESEFPQLRPKKNRAGNRAYRDKDIEMILFIKHLLYEEQFTIPGAKKKLSESKTSEIEQMKLELTDDNDDEVPLTTDTTMINAPSFEAVRQELSDILKILKR